jgi:hypothetical protein
MPYRHKFRTVPAHKPKLFTVSTRGREWQEERCAACKMKYPCPTALNNTESK